MKKILCLLLVLALGVAMSGCCLPLNLLTKRTKPPQVENDVIQMPTQNVDIPEETEPAEKRVELPNFENQSLESAKKWMDKAGVSAEIQLEYAFSDTVAEGNVISQSVPAGIQIADGHTVTLIISKGPEACPYDYAQKLTVTAASGSSVATAVLYNWEQGNWKQVAVYSASVGKNGIGPAAEGSRRTPEGTYKLGVVLTGNDVNTNMPTRSVSSNTCVVDDKNSPYYNMIMQKEQVPSGTSFDQIGKSLSNGSVYATIYIEHNGNGLTSENVVPGKGSAIGVRGKRAALAPTYGDVDISYNDMIDLLSRLDADKNPVIEIYKK